MMGNDDLGVLSRDGGACTVTFTRRFDHPPEKVWRAVTEADHLAVWFPQRIVGEWRAGAALRFEMDEGAFDGSVVAVEPPTLLELMWGTDRLRIELRPDGDGTVMTFTDTFDEVGKAARDATGWHECLDRLVGELAGGDPPAWGATWRSQNATYQAAFGAEASVIGPPDDWEPEASAGH